MSGHKDSFTDRLKHASAAKKTALATFDKRPRADDPEFKQRQAERMTANAARKARLDEQRQARQAEIAARQAEITAKQSADAAKAAEAEAKQKAVPTEEERKAARDARYAARKARR